MTAILVTSPDYGALQNAVDELMEKIGQVKEQPEGRMLLVIGPADANVARINDIYRKVIYLKHINNSALIKIKDELEKLIYSSQKFKNVSVQFDFTPSGNY